MAYAICIPSTGILFTRRGAAAVCQKGSYIIGSSASGTIRAMYSLAGF